MQFPERFSNLPEYAFPRLRNLLDHHPAGGDVLHMTIGEPKHAFPAFVPEILAATASEFGRYPPNEGSPELLASISNWLAKRYGISVDPSTEVIALNGTREGLFNACIALCPETKTRKRPKVLMPNPFYQVYAVGTIAAQADPVYVPALAGNGFLPDFASLGAETLDQTAIAYICSPSNPQGAVADREYWSQLIQLAETHDFMIFADECYSEIYRDTAPVGALQVAHDIGADPERVIIFHSLSKRSNLPGLRSGFAAGGPKAIAQLRQLRTYAGAPLPLPLQRVAEHAWSDENHVIENRRLYQQKYKLADEVFGDVQGYIPPEAGFFLWLPVDDGEHASLKMWREMGVRVLPGAYLGRETDGPDPAQGFIRVAMVAPLKEMERGLRQIRNILY